MKHAAIAFCAALIAGCSTTTPPLNVYTILPSPSAREPLPAPLGHGTLRIAATRSLPSLASRSLIYLREGGESGEYLYTRWSDAPSTLIERSLLSSLQEKQLFKAVFPPTSSSRSDRILESELDAFYHRFLRDGTSEGVIDITFRLLDARTKAPLASKRFLISKPAPTNDARGGIAALSDATYELAGQCSGWLAALPDEQR